jgi:hypothetical protein
MYNPGTITIDRHKDFKVPQNRKLLALAGVGA